MGKDQNPKPYHSYQGKCLVVPWHENFGIDDTTQPEGAQEFTQLRCRILLKEDLGDSTKLCPFFQESIYRKEERRIGKSLAKTPSKKHMYHSTPQP